MLICAAFGFAYAESAPATALIVIGLICSVFGAWSFRYHKKSRILLSTKKGYFLAALCWIYCSFLGSLVFYFSGQDYSFIGSFFEASSSFTTTGATVFLFESMPKCLLLWRAISSWMGGMGIIVLVVSVLPAIGISSQSIVPSETMESIPEKVGIRFSGTGKYLYIAYCSMTLLEFFLLWVGPLDFFGALINTLTSISTGGLFISSANVAVFNNLYIRFVILAFTLVSSINYYMIYLFLRGKRSLALKNAEIRTFLKIICVATIIVALSLRFIGSYTSLWQAIKDGLCQVVSFASTSGYYVCNYSRWPTTALVVLFALLFIGGCTMSTSGGLKVTRLMIFARIIKRSIFMQIHPNAVKAIVIDKKAIDAKRVSSAMMYIFLFMLTILFSSLVISLDGKDLETTITSVISLMSNTGIALGDVGPTAYYGTFSGPAQLFMSFLMIAGRLELYALFLLFFKSFWFKDKVKSY